MKLGRNFKYRFLIFLGVCVIAISTTYIYIILSIPGEVTLLEGEEYSHLFKSPLLVMVKADREGILNVINGESAAKSKMMLTNPISLKAQNIGSVKLSMKLFGIIPLREMKVDVVSGREMVACGKTIGVKLRVDGVLVIAVSEVESVNGEKLSPARDIGIKVGDRITEVNGKALNSISELVKEIDRNANGVLKVKYRRGNEEHTADMTPVKSVDDNKYHIGLWVRDSTAGIGTLTFFDPESKQFGALGHGITDADTGTLMPISNGEILECNILGVKKGRKGDPGELKGIFSEVENTLGNIRLNSSHGVYGVLKDTATKSVYYKSYPVGLRSQVQEGPAVILCSIDGKEVKEYTVEILRVSRQNMNGSKGMVLKITDQRLLDETGGIVQGMSGSPIIQNNRLIGAVTHVLVNDPTRGYGIFIEGMLRNISGNKMSELDIAG